jgi:molybdopterin-guanine dinucleotide biosynthesis protein A
MGRDKAFLPYNNATLVDHVAGAVAQAAGSVTLVGRAADFSGPGYRCIDDLYPNCGPLGGVVTALHTTCAEWNLVVACDMPGVTPDLLGWLFERAECDCVVPARGTSLEPLCAVYHRRCLEPFRTALGTGIRRMADALDGVRVSIVEPPPGDWFRNINTPQEWQAHLNA